MSVKGSTMRRMPSHPTSCLLTTSVTLIVFVIINLAPGSPVERKLQELQFGGAGAGGDAAASVGTSNDSSAVSQEVIDALKKQYGFDKPLHVRYFIWLKNLVTLDFGESFTYEEPVTDVIISKFPVSLQFGILSLLLSYMICIPLGVLKAIYNGTVLSKRPYTRQPYCSTNTSQKPHVPNN